MAAERGLSFVKAQTGEHVSGRLVGAANLASGRFAMIDDGVGFQLVPWQPALEKRISMPDVFGSLIQSSMCSNRKRPTVATQIAVSMSCHTDIELSIDSDVERTMPGMVQENANSRRKLPKTGGFGAVC
ncbi:DUF3363 domain-containing protein [Mesorhizobium sp. MSK_1335]|uniref:DUF3363 domain-containing protein n=1 Tax=Mesorhizobium montanum TaxID=3072323 RepID=A0ABU4ZCG2_9HYPH|nr:DUF3363 domain-containing protein [Mesorhizobium sp. MSK_1335]MDX8523024.1 DUF3363 domain-containing protein [Mesorhizobium sp. MSK_1335]